MFSIYFNLFIIKSWGKIAKDYNQILKDQAKSNGFNDLWIIAAKMKATP